MTQPASQDDLEQTRAIDGAHSLEASLDLVGRVALDGVLGALLGRDRGVHLGRYRVADTIGTGAFGQVFRAHDAQLDRDVAIKVMLPERVHRSDDAEHARLLREARALARLRHPNVVEVFDVGVGVTGKRADGSPQHGVYVVMQWLPGESLAAFAERRPPVAAIVDAWIQVARGLEAAHREGLVHGDIKPDNAIIDEAGRVRVVDFGLAREATPRGDTEPGGTTEASAVTSISGTPVYMAPEQHRGVMSPAADQYALCVSLWRALSGSLPFVGRDLDALAVAKHAATPRAGEREVPRRIAAVLRRGLAVDPRRRFADVGALADALVRAQTTGRARWFGAGALGVVSVGLLAASVSPTSAHPCASEPLSLAATWDPTVRGETLARLGNLAHPDATTIATRIATELDRRAESWRTTYDAVCDGAPSPDSVAIHRCLAEAAGSLAAAVEALGGTTEHDLANAPAAIAQVPMGRHCAELASRTPEELRELAEIRARAAALHSTVQGARPAGDLAWVEPALARADALGEPGLAIELQHDAAIAEMIALDDQRAVVRLRDAIWRANANDDPLRALEIMPTLIETHLGLRETEQAEQLLATAREQLQRYGGDARHGALLDIATAQVAIYTGSTEESDRMYRKACDTLASLPDPSSDVMHCSAALMLSALWRSDVDGAEAALQLGLDAVPRIKDPDEGVWVGVDHGLGEIARARGRLHETTEIFERQLRRAQLQYDPYHPAVIDKLERVAEVHGAAGRWDQALAMFDDILANTKPSLEGTSVTELALLSRARLNLTLVAGRHAEIDAAAARAMSVTEGSRAAEWFQPWARTVLAYEAWRRGDATTARIELDRAMPRLLEHADSDTVSAARLGAMLDAEAGDLDGGRARLGRAIAARAAQRATDEDPMAPDPTEPALDAFAAAMATALADPDADRDALRELYIVHVRSAAMLRHVAMPSALDHF